MATKSSILLTINTPQGKLQAYMMPEEAEILKHDKEALRNFIKKHQQAQPTGDHDEPVPDEPVPDVPVPDDPVPDEPEPEEEVYQDGAKSGSWGKPDTLFLIQEYCQFLKQVETGRMTKKAMWQMISRHLNEKGFVYNVDQVSGRWKSLVRAYKTTQGNNRKSGSGRKTFEYQSQFDQIFENDPTVKPEYTLSSSSSSSTSSTSEEHAPAAKPAKRMRRSDVAETVQSFIHEQQQARKEESERRERMHKEKIETMKSLISLFSKWKKREESDSD